MIRSLRHAARRLARARGFSAAAILTLTIGLAATTTVFSAVNAVLLRPLPYDRADRLVFVSHTLVVGATLAVDQSDASLLYFRRHQRAFSRFAGYQPTAAALGPGGGADAERVPAARVTADFFPALGVSALGGRLYEDADDRPGAPRVAVIGERLWTRKYGRDPNLPGRIVEIDGVGHEVIGIVAGVVRFPSPETEVWLPLRLDPATTDSATFDYQAIARLRDGITIDAAATDLQALLPRLPDEFPGRMTRRSIEQTRMQVSVRPLASVVVGDVGRVLWLVLGAAAFVLAIACANVANLFLVRAEDRRTAVAVQRALGAPGRVILLDVLGEGVLVAVAGGTLGVLLALAGVQAASVLGAAFDLPRSAELNVDRTVLALAVALTAAAAIVISGLSAYRSSAAASLGSRPATIGRERQRARRVLVASQVALALVLLAGSGLMARSVWRLRAVQPGFEPAHAMTFRMALPPATYPGTDAPVRFFARTVEALANIPGVVAAGAVSKLPLDEQGRTDSGVFLEGRPLQPGALPGIHPVVYATPGYFEAAGIPLISGRRFDPPDPPQADLEAIVSAAFAERYWKGESPIGKRVRILINGPLYTIVGVVGNVRDSALDRPADPTIYCPLLPAREDRRWSPRDLAFVVRTAGNPAAVTAGIRDAVRGLDRALPLYRIRPLTGIVAQATARRSFTFFLIGGASLVALLLGAIGLYGVMSYVVTLRTREMGIRLALGADPRQLRRMVSRQGLATAGLGVAAGLAGAVVLTRSLSALLFEVSPTDPVVLAVSAGLLLAVAAAASWLPARRAAAVDPACTLRAE